MLFVQGIARPLRLKSGFLRILSEFVFAGSHVSPQPIGAVSDKTLAGELVRWLTVQPPSSRSTFLRLAPAFLAARFTSPFDLPVFFASYRTS
jgi:hypothetical protein